MKQILEISREMYDHKNPEKVFKKLDGLNKDVVRAISDEKKEPEWMLNKRLEALRIFLDKPIPRWGPDLSRLDFNKIRYYLKAEEKTHMNKWEDVPEYIKKTFERLGIPEAEKKSLAGAGAMYESEVMYHNLKKEWEEKGVIFEDMDVALQKYPDLVKKYFMSECVPINDHKFAALHGATWSGGTFIFIPKNVRVTMPLQAYFRMNAPRGGQFEHTLIVADEGAEVSYLEGCSSPIYSENSIHAGCVEIFVHKNARVRYMSIENWSRNTYNLNTKRAVVFENGVIEWINGNFGCLTGDTKIFTDNRGLVEIKDIKNGDYVYSLDENDKIIKKQIVNGKVSNGIKDVYELDVNGRTIRATSNHPFLALERKMIKGIERKGRFVTKWKSLEELKENDLIALPKKIPISGQPYRLSRIEIPTNRIIGSNNQYAKFRMNLRHLYKAISVPEYTNENLMWFLGIFIGNGNIWERKNTDSAKVTIAIPEYDSLRDELVKVTKNIFDYRIKQFGKRAVIINSGLVARFIKKIDFGGRSYEKKIPRWVYSLPEDQRLSLLAGIIDSDGHIHKGEVAITSVNKELLEDVKMLAFSCGLNASRVFKHSSGGRRWVAVAMSNARDAYRLLLNGPNIKNIPLRDKPKNFKLLKSTSKRNFVSSKGLNFKHQTSDYLGFARISSIKYIGKEEVFDIEVENSHNFIANGIIVHNSAVTMLYPCSVLKGRNARSEFIGIAYAGKDQNQDTGHKVFHLAQNTSSTVVSKSISKDGGITTYRGMVYIAKGAVNSKCKVQCDALMLDNKSVSNTIPYMNIKEQKVNIGHEASVGKIDDEKLFYLQSRGLKEEDARKLIVSGFVEPISRQLPMEYALEFNRLVELEMETSLG